MSLNARNVLSKADNLLKKGKTEEAKIQYDLVLSEYPHNKHAKNALAQLANINSTSSAINIPLESKIENLISMYQTGNYTEALIYGEALHKESPANPFVPNIVGAVHRALGNPTKAIDCYRMAIHLNNKYSEAYNNLGIILNELGRHDEAIDAYNKAIRISPQFTEALSNLGVALTDAGQIDIAIRTLRKAIQINIGYASAYYNLGDAYTKQKKYSEAITSFSKVVELEPHNPRAQFSLAGVLHLAGIPEEAVLRYQRAIELNPNYSEAYNNAGIVLNELSRHDEAIHCYEQAIKIDPGYAQAYNNCGLAFHDSGKFIEATDMYNKAIELDSKYANAQFNLGNSLNKTGQSVLAVNCYRKALEINPDFAEARNNLSSILSSLHFTQSEYRADWAKMYLDLLKVPNCSRPNRLAVQICELVKLHPSISKILLSTEETNSALYLSTSLFDELPVLLKLMELTPIPDLQLENVFKRLRLALLKQAPSKSVSSEISQFQLALALQSIVNEFVYGETSEETLLVEALVEKLEKNAFGKSPFDWYGLVVLASYRPLLDFDWTRELDAPSAIKVITERGIDNCIEEDLIAESIPSLNKPKNQVSINVQQQYEINPYPRWIATHLDFTPRTLSQLESSLNLKFSKDSIQHLVSPDVLIAGCGTGQHPLATAARIRNCKVLAIDLSRKSLAYAARKSREFGFENIKYLQADILDVGLLGKTFDVIESVGVLHHMEDPFLACKLLCDSLKPGGLLRLGFYSQIARQSISEVRSHIAQLGIGNSKHEMLDFREQLIHQSQNAPHIEKITSMADFYSTSELRDLLFHVQEHQFTLPVIKTSIERLGLNFAGFEFTSDTVKELFLSKFTAHDALYNLDSWHEFELEYPDTFIGMYQFWAQKRSE